MSDLLPSHIPTDLILAAESAAVELIGQDWTPLRGGRTNQTWKVGSAVVKAYSKNADTPLFPNDPGAEAWALKYLSRSGLCPELIATGPTFVIYRYVKGDVGGRSPEAVGKLLAKLHAYVPPLGHGLRMAPMGKEFRDHALSIAGRDLPQLPPCPEPPPLVPEGAKLVHGDAVFGNIIDGAAGPVLIDWQCPALGDPIEDIAAYLSPAMQWLYGGKAVSTADRDRFFVGYACQKTKDRYLAMAPILHWRLAAHCLWKAAKGHTDYAQALSLEVAGLTRFQNV